MKKPDGTWDKFDDYVVDFALDHMRGGERIALVTLAKIEGSSPRPLGAQMAVSQTGDWVGYLSGGCLERAVVAEALLAIEEGKRRLVRYGRGSKYLDIHLPCGSAIDLIFDVEIDVNDLATIHADVSDRKAGVMRIPTGNCDNPGEVVFRHYPPRRRLIVAGVGPAALHLAILARSSGFETALYSPDAATGHAAKSEAIKFFPISGATNVPIFKIDVKTAIAFMFHDHEWERLLIPAVLDSDAFYIGAMGSRRTHQQRLLTLRENGIDPARLRRVRGPAGLFSGAKSAADVALSILAEIVQIERSANAPILSYELTPVDENSPRFRQLPAG